MLLKVFLNVAYTETSFGIKRRGSVTIMSHAISLLVTIRSFKNKHTVYSEDFIMLLDDVLKELHGRHNTFILLEKRIYFRP